MHEAGSAERINTVVVGGGQAGLSVGYHLARRGVPFVILDAAARVGDQWRNRWDSLRLFTPAKFSGIDGLRFPAPPNAFPTKDEMADYLESYVRTFDLPVRPGCRVERLSRRGDRFVVVAGGQVFDADNVVVAMSGYQRPRVPPFAEALSSDIVQIHSANYRSPSQLKDGAVLVVGAGNSGAEIAKEVSGAHETWLAGKDVGQIPFRVDGPAGQAALVRLTIRGLFHRVLTVRTPIGRRVRQKVLHGSGPLIRTKRRHLADAGVQLVPRVDGVSDGRPRLADGRTLDAQNVVWCTGYLPGFSWIDLPVFDSAGDPRHRGGIVASQPGLYFVGLHFLYALSSAMIHGVGRDAKRVANAIAGRGLHRREAPGRRRHRRPR